MPADVQEIKTLDDPRVDVFRDVRDRDLRGRSDLFMAESEMVIHRLLHHPERIHSMLLSPKRFEALRDAIETSSLKAPVYIAPIELMCDIAGFHIHRGALAAGVRSSPENLRLESALGFLENSSAATVLVAEGLTNVDNMGAIFRNAAAFGANAVLLGAACCDPLYRKAIRVSMGHALSVPYAISHDWPTELAILKKWGMTIIGAESIESAIPLWELPRSDRIAMVFGSEGRGLTRPVLEMCDAICEIPMSGEVSSLNVAVASAVFLYEHARARIQ